MPDQSHVGRSYKALGQVVDQQHVAAFAAAIAGDDTPFAAGTVPPTFAAVYCVFPTMGQLFADAEVGLDMAHLVHGEQHFEWPHLVCVGDVVDANCTIVSVEQKRSLTYVGIDVEAVRSADGATVCRGYSLMVIRGGG